MKRKSYEIDMCNGPLFSKILLFAIPLMISSILQLLFNAADMVVVGRFAGSTALAAVGANASLINLLTNLFIGFSVGANVLVARFYGAGKEQDISETVHSAVVLSLVSGLGLMVFGMAVAPRILVVMGTPGDVLSQAVLYIRIYFAGMPVILLYNFGSSILRAVGDTRRPLYYLSGAGVINVVLNLIFVIGFHLGVAGVALATVISQVISAGPGFPLSDPYERGMPGRMAENADEKGKGDADCAYRSSGRTAGNGIFPVQCADTVLSQFFWFRGHGGQYGSSEYRRFYLHVHECLPSDCPELYQSEFWSRKLQTNWKSTDGMPGHGNGCGTCNGLERISVRRPASGYLFFGPESH